MVMMIFWYKICYKIIDFYIFTVTAKLKQISFVYMRNLQWSLLPLDEACQMIYIPVDTLWLPHMLLRRITSKSSVCMCMCVCVCLKCTICSYYNLLHDVLTTYPLISEMQVFYTSKYCSRGKCDLKVKNFNNSIFLQQYQPNTSGVMQTFRKPNSLKWGR